VILLHLTVTSRQTSRQRLAPTQQLEVAMTGFLQLRAGVSPIPARQANTSKNNILFTTPISAVLLQIDSVLQKLLSLLIVLVL